jgi:hypothetical protein
VLERRSGIGVKSSGGVRKLKSRVDKGEKRVIRASFVCERR